MKGNRNATTFHQPRTCILRSHSHAPNPCMHQNLPTTARLFSTNIKSKNATTCVRSCKLGAQSRAQHLHSGFSNRQQPCSDIDCRPYRDLSGSSPPQIIRLCNTHKGTIWALMLVRYSNTQLTNITSAPPFRCTVMWCWLSTLARYLSTQNSNELSRIVVVLCSFSQRYVKFRAFWLKNFASTCRIVVDVHEKKKGWNVGPRVSSTLNVILWLGVLVEKNRHAGLLCKWRSAFLFFFRITRSWWWWWWHTVGIFSLLCMRFLASDCVLSWDWLVVSLFHAHTGLHGLVVMRRAPR